MENTKTVSIKKQNKSAASSLMKKNIRKFMRNKLAVLGLVIVVAMTVASIMSMVLKVDYSTPDLQNMKVRAWYEWAYFRHRYYWKGLICQSVVWGMLLYFYWRIFINNVWHYWSSIRGSCGIFWRSSR